MSDDNKKELRSQEERRDDNLRWFFEKQPMPLSGEKPQYTGGRTFDDIINDHATGGIEGADRRLAQESRKILDGGEGSKRFRPRRPGETDKEYEDALFSWGISGRPDQTPEFGEWDVLRQNAAVFMQEHGTAISAVRSAAGVFSSSINMFMTAMEIVVNPQKNFTDLTPRHTYSLSNGESILNRAALMAGDEKVANAALAYADGGPAHTSIAGCWDAVQEAAKERFQYRLDK